MNDIVVYGFYKICSDRDLEISCQNKNFSDGKLLSKSWGYLVLWQGRVKSVQMQFVTTYTGESTKKKKEGEMGEIFKCCECD